MVPPGHEATDFSDTDVLHSVPTQYDLAALVRQIVPATDPSVVLSSLASQCVPAFSDFCAIELRESERPVFRISVPSADEGGSEMSRTAPMTRGSAGAAHAVTTPFRSTTDDLGTAFRGVVTHVWNDRRPTHADRITAALVVDRAVALIGHERLGEDARRAHRQAENLEIALTSSREIGIALGFMMHAQNISSEQAFDMLRAVSQRSHRKLREVAVEVIAAGRAAAPTPAQPIAAP